MIFRTLPYFHAGFLVCVIIIACLCIRLRLSVLRSMTFLLNLLFLFVYYLPYYTLKIPLLPESQHVIVIGHFMMNLGLLVGFLIADALVPAESPTPPKLLNIEVPERGFLIIMFVTGICGYSILYATRGIPLLSHDIDIAREDFISGAGVITWPSTILINSAIWSLCVRKYYRLSMAFCFLGGTFFLMSGWRGQLVLTVIPIFYICTYQRKVTWKLLLAGLASLCIFALFGLFRTNASGYSLYGLMLKSGMNLREYPLMIYLYLINRFGEHAINFDIAVSYFSGNLLGGKGMLMDFSFLLPGSNMTVGAFMKEMFGKWEGGGGMPITMLGGFYADFGAWGIILISFLAAAFHAILVRTLQKLSKVSNLTVMLLGYANAFWVLGFLGSYFRDFLPQALVYSAGIWMTFLTCHMMNRGATQFAGDSEHANRHYHCNA
ncbi:MAG: hypothetical protein Kow0099_29880 [Candidatus Abyssubacteria bacterium]